MDHTQQGEQSLENTIMSDTRTQRGMLCIDQEVLRTFTLPKPPSHTPTLTGEQVLEMLEPALAAVGLTALTDIEFVAQVASGALEIRFTHPSLPLRELTDRPTVFSVTHDADGYHVQRGHEG